MPVTCTPVQGSERMPYRGPCYRRFDEISPAYSGEFVTCRVSKSLSSVRDVRGLMANADRREKHLPSLEENMASTPQVALSAACAAACNTDGRLELFGVGTDFALWHIWQTVPGAGPWSSWSSLSGVITSNPAVAVNKDGRLEVFGRGTDGALWHIWQTAPHAGPWSAWSSLGGGISSDLTVSSDLAGCLYVFVRGTDGALWYIMQTAPGAAAWSAWISLGGSITSDPAVALNTDGLLEVFARGTDNALWHIWQTGPSDTDWSGWSSLGGIITSTPSVAVNTDGRLEVFARGTDYALWHIWQTVPHAGPWSAWSSLAGIITSDPAVAVNTDGRLEVFARGSDDALWHIWQTVPHAGPWSAWSSLAGSMISPVVYLGLKEQPQQQSEWCWLATTTSITLYYSPAYTGTQCSLANTELSQTTCCTNGSSSACNQPGYPDQALTTTGHLASTAMGAPTLQTIIDQIEAGHPVSINIQWIPSGSGGHNPATDGYDNRDSAAPTLDIQDPWYGPSTQDFNSFPGSYNGGATWYESYFTR
jgi:hypothetical protein